MWDFSDVIKIEYRRGYIFFIQFDDGSSAEVDFSIYLDRGPGFYAWRDLSFFKSASIDGGTIAWPNGADIAPETLYAMVKNCRPIQSSVQA